MIYDVGHLFMCVQVHFFACGCPVVPASFVENTAELYCFAFVLCQRLVNSILKGLFLDSLFCFTDPCPCIFSCFLYVCIPKRNIILYSSATCFLQPVSFIHVHELCAIVNSFSLLHSIPFKNNSVFVHSI